MTAVFKKARVRLLLERTASVAGAIDEDAESVATRADKLTGAPLDGDERALLAEALRTSPSPA